MLTLYTTPVVYLYMDRMRLWWEHRRHPAIGARESAS
jgi:multidrug efflux pump